MHHEPRKPRVARLSSLKHYEDSFGRVRPGGDTHRRLTDLDAVTPDVDRAVGVTGKNAERSGTALARLPYDASLGIGNGAVPRRGRLARKKDVGGTRGAGRLGSLLRDHNRRSVRHDPVHLL